MIFFEVIRWKNFLSTGNAFTEIPLSKFQNTLVVGDNGSGKSTILDALVFVLFGKPYRNIKKPTLTNAINTKNCVVEIEFSINSRSYKIRRGLKPALFEIICDGICLNQDSDSRDYQEYLEKNILNMSLKTFTQIVILGSANYTPFMQLNALDRRSVIENVTDTEIFSRMTLVTKARLQGNMEALENNGIRLVASQDKQNFIKRTLDKLKTSNEERIAILQKTIDDNQKIIANSREDVADLLVRLSELSASLVDGPKLSKRHQSMIVLHSKLDANHEKNEKEIDFFHDHDTCPTCTQHIDEKFKASRTEELVGYRRDLEEGMSKLSVDIEDCAAQIAHFNNVSTRMAGIRSVVATLQARTTNSIAVVAENTAEINRLQNADGLVDTSQQEFDEVAAEIVVLETEKKELLSQKLYIDTALALLKDGGLKSRIIRQYLPVINKMINQHLGKMGFAINFNLNEQFDESIKSRHRETFSYENFSQGQKLRIDLALLFAWRGIAKRKNSVDCNLLIMDEILDRSLDSNGVEDFIKIMQGLSDKTNIFIISPKQDHLVDKFQCVYQFSEIRKFSKMVKV